MSVLVVDASVVRKWFLPEVHSAAARDLLQEAHQFVVPDLLFPEVGNAIRKKVRRGELSRNEAQRLVAALAVRLETRVITADERFERAITSNPVLAKHICMVDAFAP